MLPQKKFPSFMVARRILEFNVKFRRYSMLEKKVKMMPLGDVSIQDDFGKSIWNW